MDLKHTLASISSSAGHSWQNITLIHPSKVTEQDGPADADLRLVDVCQVVVARSLGFRPGKGRRSKRDPLNFPSSLPIFNNILSNENRPLIATPFGRRFLVSSASHFFKAASLRQWLVSDLLVRQRIIIAGRVGTIVVCKLQLLPLCLRCSHRADQELFALSLTLPHGARSA